MNFLAKIVAHKLQESEALFTPETSARFQQAISVRPPAISFKAALDATPGTAIIAEIKRASPSKGEFALHWDPVELAQVYQDNGAAALSVLTEVKYFKGDPEFIRQMRASGVRATRFSKYCIGVSMLYPEIKHNNFKPQLRQITRLLHERKAACRTCSSY